MKSFLASAFLIFSFATMGCSQKINENDLPNPVKTAFNTKFPGASGIKWGKENAKEYEAEFKLNNTSASANFGLDGSWVETETVIPLADLPAAVSTSVTKKYPGAIITMVEKLEMPGDKLLYETTFKVNGKKKSLELYPDGSLAK